MALGVTFFTAIDTSARWLALAGLVPLQVAFVRFAGHFLFALVVYPPQEGPGVARSARPGVQFLRSLALPGSTTLNFAALSHLPLTVTTSIMFAGPMVVTLMAIPLLGERVGVHRMGAVVAGFVGVLVVVQPCGAEFHPAMLLTLSALSCMSIHFILTRKLAGTERNATSQIWASGVPALCLAPSALQVWVWPDSPLELAVMVDIGLVGALGHIFATSALRFADASVLALSSISRSCRRRLQAGWCSAPGPRSGP